MKNKVAICTPSYDGKVTTQYMNFLIEELKQTDHEVFAILDSGDSLVSRSRNYIFSIFAQIMDKESLTHLLWVDSDVSIDAGGVQKMLERNVDVIASPVPLKEPGPSHHGWAQSVVGIIDETEPMFYRAEYAATGCLMLSVKAVRAIIKYCDENNLKYTDGDEYYDAFRSGANDGFYESEDWYICRVLRDLGFDIYIDSSFGVFHIGSVSSIWYRPPMPLSETILNNQWEESLSVEMKYQRWTTNDYSPAFQKRGGS